MVTQELKGSSVISLDAALIDSMEAKHNESSPAVASVIADHSSGIEKPEK